MRALILTAAIAAVPAAAFAQQPIARAYVNGTGGFATTSDGTSGDWSTEAGVKVARHLFAFGDFGRFHNLQPSAVAPAVDSATTALANLGIDVTGNPRVPAWYLSGGLRAEIPAGRHLIPYVFGSVGTAWLTPESTFSYASGTLGTTTPNLGDNVTAQVVSLGDYSQPAATSALMTSLGGGIEAPIAGRLVFDASYRFSHINADTPVHPQGVTFGIGYKF